MPKSTDGNGHDLEEHAEAILEEAQEQTKSLEKTLETLRRLLLARGTVAPPVVEVEKKDEGTDD